MITKIKPRIEQRNWQWRGWKIRYVFCRSNAPQSLENNSKPAILLLHGFGAAVGHWRGNYQALSAEHQVYALDLLGFGNSEKPATAYGASLWVEQVFDFWQTFIGQPVVLVGNSIGSLVALMATHQHPEMSSGVVAISLPDFTELENLIPKPIRPIKRALETIVGAVLARPLFYLAQRSIKFVLKNLVYVDKSRVDRELVQIITQPTQDPQAVEAFYCLVLSMNFDQDFPSAASAIAQLAVPILILWGSQDRVIPPFLGAKLVKFSPLANLVELPNMGHCPQDENPEVVNHEILMWMQKCFNDDFFGKI